MWIDKLAGGVVRVITPLGPRYLMPSFKQRLYLMWVFRHFPILPQQVLSNRQRRLVERLCSEQRFVAMAYAEGIEDAPVIGTVERRLPVGVEELPPRRPVSGVASAGSAPPLVAEFRQRS